MQINQEHYVIPWWKEEPSYRKEMMSEGIRLHGAIAMKRNQINEARLFNEVYATIVQNEGHIFEEDHDLVRSCRELGVNRQELDSKMHQVMEELNGTIGTSKAAELLWLPPRKVRQLIADGMLKASKEKGKWSLCRIDVIRLAAENLGLKA